MNNSHEILEGRCISVKGRTIYYVASNLPADSEPPVVLVHGVGLSHRYLLPTAVRLAQDFRIFIPDLPGFGKSFKPRRVLTIPELADWLAAWIEAMGLGPAALVGNSFGCQKIVDLAVRFPELVSRAVLQGPTCDPEARTYPQQVWRWFINRNMESQPNEPILVRDSSGDGLRIRKVYPVNRHDYRESGLWRVLKTFRYALDDPLVEKLPRMRCPTLVVRGTRDIIVPQRWAEEVVRLLPQGRLVVLPGVPHTANLESPLELTRVVRPFLEEQRQAAFAAS